MNRQLIHEPGPQTIQNGITRDGWAMQYPRWNALLGMAPGRSTCLGGNSPKTIEETKIVEGELLFTGMNMPHIHPGQPEVFSNLASLVIDQKGPTGGRSQEETDCETAESNLILCGVASRGVTYQNGMPTAGQRQIAFYIQGSCSPYNSGDSKIFSGSLVFWGVSAKPDGYGRRMPITYSLTPEKAATTFIPNNRFKVLMQTKLFKDQMKNICMPFAIIVSDLFDKYKVAHESFIEDYNEHVADELKKLITAAPDPALLRDFVKDLQDGKLADRFYSKFDKDVKDVMAIFGTDNSKTSPRDNAQRNTTKDAIAAYNNVNDKARKIRMDKICSLIVDMFVDSVLNSKGGEWDSVLRHIQKGMLPMSAALVLELFSKFVGVALEDIMPGKRGAILLTPTVKSLLYKVSSVNV